MPRTKTHYINLDDTLEIRELDQNTYNEYHNDPITPADGVHMRNIYSSDPRGRVLATDTNYRHNVEQNHSDVSSHQGTRFTHQNHPDGIFTAVFPGRYVDIDNVEEPQGFAPARFYDSRYLGHSGYGMGCGDTGAAMSYARADNNRVKNHGIHH